MRSSRKKKENTKQLSFDQNLKLHFHSKHSSKNYKLSHVELKLSITKQKIQNVRIIKKNVLESVNNKNNKATNRRFLHFPYIHTKRVVNKIGLTQTITGYVYPSSSLAIVVARIFLPFNL